MDRTIYTTGSKTRSNPRQVAGRLRGKALRAKRLANALFLAGCVTTGVIVAICTGHCLAVMLLLLSVYQ